MARLLVASISAICALSVSACSNGASKRPRLGGSAPNATGIQPGSGQTDSGPELTPEELADIAAAEKAKAEAERAAKREAEKAKKDAEKAALEAEKAARAEAKAAQDAEKAAKEAEAAAAKGANRPASPDATATTTTAAPKSVGTSEPVSEIPNVNDVKPADKKTQSPAETKTEAKPETKAEAKPAAKKPAVEIPVGNSDTTETEVADKPKAPKAPSNQNRDCGTAYRRNTEDWFPGLPSPPASLPKLTGAVENLGRQDQAGADQSSADQIQYTDASADGLLNYAVDQVNRIPEDQQRATRFFATRIRDVRLNPDFQQSGQVSLEFVFQVEREQFGRVRLAGQFQNRNGSGSRSVNLRQVSNEGGPQLQATLTCQDKGNGCQNSLITVRQLNQEGRATRTAYIVYRSGSAHVSISDQDQLQWSQLQNKAHQAFAEYLSNTANNSCLTLITVARANRSQVPACALQRLQALCGGKQKRSPAVDAFNLRTWAVAYGLSGFEFEAVDSGQVRVAIAGPLVVSNQRPMNPNALAVQGRIGIEKAHMIANDGAGNLNLQIIFKGEPVSHLRLNISSQFLDSRFKQNQQQANNSWRK
jgi:hypothetical protein